MAGEHVIIMPGRVGADMTRILALNDSSPIFGRRSAAATSPPKRPPACSPERYEVDEATALRDAQAWAGKLAECGAGVAGT